MPKFRNVALSEMTPAHAAVWNSFCGKLSAVSIETPSELATFQEWAVRVARYAFHTVSLVEAH